MLFRKSKLERRLGNEFVKTTDKAYDFYITYLLHDHKMNARIKAPKDSVRILLSEIIDYAGLFPPSMVSMPEAVANYARYKNSFHGWMLGRFIVPAARLDEFFDSAEDLFPKRGENMWRLSVLAGEDINATIRSINTFNGKNAHSVVCDSLEVKANTISKIENTVNALPEGITTYFELGPNKNLIDLVATLAHLGQRAKIRTGGVAREDFPTSKEIIRFVRTCMTANVPFKATAGLHHPIRCFRPLTYAPEAPQGTMHGFLNMLLMTAFVREGYRTSLMEELMEEELDEAFTFHDDAIRWRNEHIIPVSQLALLRQRGMISFGSCSFDEPIADLQSLSLL